MATSQYMSEYMKQRTANKNAGAIVPYEQPSYVDPNSVMKGTIDYMTPADVYKIDARHWANLQGTMGTQQWNRMTDAYKQWADNQQKTNALSNQAFSALTQGGSMGPTNPIYNQYKNPAARNDVSQNIPFLGSFSGNYPQGLTSSYYQQVQTPGTNYGSQVDTTKLSTWTAPDGSQYNVDPEILKSLTAGATPEDIQAAVERAYGTLGSMDLQNYGSALGGQLESELARRGITGSSGATNRKIGLANWQQTQGARLGAEGTLAGINAAESARAARNQALLSGEGLKQAAAASALGLGTTEEQIRAARAAEILNALTTASNLENQYVTGGNEALRLKQALETGGIELERQGIKDVEDILRQRQAGDIQAATAKDAIQKGLYGEAFDRSKYDREQELIDYAAQLANYWQTMNLWNQNQGNLANLWTGNNPLGNVAGTMGGVEQSEASSSPWNLVAGVVGNVLGSVLGRK